jgi:lauroyl/myristoyl acyltransferase
VSETVPVEPVDSAVGATARPTLPTRVTARLTDAGFAAGWGAVKLMPEGLARRGFGLIGAGTVRRDGAGVRQLRANLRVATCGRLSEAELDELTERAMRSYMRYWEEAFRLPTLSRERIVSSTETTGLEHMERVRREGRGHVMALPHSGNWDAAGVWFVDWLAGPFMTIAERLKPESLFRRFLEYRESLGMRVVPLTGGERPSAVLLREWLDGGGSICLVSDRDFARSGVPVTFFGRPTTLPAGPALLAAQTGAALIPAVCQFTDTGWRVVFHPEVPVPAEGRLKDRVAQAMQGVADAFTATIPERPEDWHMLGRIWSDVPGDAPRRGAR